MQQPDLSKIDEQTFSLALAKAAYSQFGISESAIEQALKIESTLAPSFSRIEAIKAYNQLKVIRAFQSAKLAESDFAATTGYGYNDSGREKIEQIYAEVFGAERALVRLSISSGTQAIALALYGCLRPGDEMLACFGKPYDTLDSIIGLGAATQNLGSLRDYGVSYRQVDLLENGQPDLAGILEAITAKTKLVHLQRSKGYLRRPAYTLADLEPVIRAIKMKKPDIIVFVDNCYGEFTEINEPLAVGADLIAGSLIKNPGGGLAPCGGYVAGKAKLVELAHCRLTAPGIAGEVGPSLGFNRQIIQGLYLAPHVVAECLKGLEFAAAYFKAAGYQSKPEALGIRSDIVQLLQFNTAEELIKFCQAIQAASPIDSHFKPVPWDMPGYDAPVIMACGAFIQGSSLELSADGPIKEPYTAYLQGGLVYENVKLAVLMAAEAMRNS